ATPARYRPVPCGGQMTARSLTDAASLPSAATPARYRPVPCGGQMTARCSVTHHRPIPHHTLHVVRRTFAFSS
ncbi:hypothetical protein, partial [Chloroflexus sp.]|uniref:hypothetical protein n=1 Tax=Chloroflexus sp. TaxID=1904827 RepID=UPI003C70FD56